MAALAVYATMSLKMCCRGIDFLVTYRDRDNKLVEFTIFLCEYRADLCICAFSGV